MDKDIEKALREKKYLPLTQIQEKVRNQIKNNDTCIIAPTGSGKTAAYLIPTLSDINTAQTDTQLLIIAPTRELAVQISKEAEAIGTYKAVHIVTLIGGQDERKQVNSLKNRPHVIIATPGRLSDLLSKDMITTDHIHAIVMDEADQIYSAGQRDEVNGILNTIHHSNTSIQTILTTATWNERLTEWLKEDYVKIEMEEENPFTAYLYHYSADSETERREAVSFLLHHLPVTSAIVYSAMKGTAENLSAYLQNQNILSHDFSSRMNERERLKTLKDFSEGKIRVLSATDAAARGLDIPDVSHVIHFDLPQDEETFIHRSGRSGHQQGQGISVIMTNKSDTIPDYIKTTEEITLTEDETDLSTPIKKEEKSDTAAVKYILRAGKKDKIRVKDLIGALCTITTFGNVGTIDLQDSYTAFILFETNTQLEERLQSLTVKGKKRRIERAKSV